MTEMPPAIAEYFRAIDSRTPGDAAQCFTEDAVIAMPHPDDEVGERVVRRGRSVMHQLLSTRGDVPWAHRLTRHLGADGRWLVQGSLLSRTSGDTLSRFAVYIELDPATDLIGSFLSFRRQADGLPAVDPMSADEWLRVLRGLESSNGPFETSTALAADAYLSLPPRPTAGTIAAVEPRLLVDDGRGLAVQGTTPDGRLEVVISCELNSAHDVERLVTYWCPAVSDNVH
jgi:hypothetical protein